MMLGKSRVGSKCRSHTVGASVLADFAALMMVVEKRMMTDLLTTGAAYSSQLHQSHRNRPFRVLHLRSLV